MKIAVSAQYIAAAIQQRLEVLEVLVPEQRRAAEQVRPGGRRPRNASSAVSFIIAMNSLPVGGMMTRVACGSTTRRIFCRYVMPSASAASDCP